MGPVWRLRLGYGSSRTFPSSLINSDCVLQPHAGDRCEKSFPPAHSLCLLLHPASRAKGGGGCLTTLHHPQNSSQGQLKIPACFFSSNLGFNLG